MSSENAQCSSRSGFWFLKISRKMRVLKQSQSALFCSVTLAVLPTWQYCLYSHVWWMYEIKRDCRLSHALVHLVTALASLLTDHRISSLPIRVKHRNFRTIWEHTFDNSPTDWNSSSLKWWSSMHGLILWRVVESSCLPTQKSFHTLLCMTNHVMRPWRNTKILREW